MMRVILVDTIGDSQINKFYGSYVVDNSNMERGYMIMLFRTVPD